MSGFEIAGLVLGAMGLAPIFKDGYMMVKEYRQKRKQLKVLQYNNAYNSTYTLKHTLDDSSTALTTRYNSLHSSYGNKFATGDSISREELCKIIIILQGEIIMALRVALVGGTLENPYHLNSVAAKSREDAIAVLAQLAQRLAITAPIPSYQWTPPSYSQKQLEPSPRIQEICDNSDDIDDFHIPLPPLGLKKTESNFPRNQRIGQGFRVPKAAAPTFKIGSQTFSTGGSKVNLSGDSDNSGKTEFNPTKYKPYNFSDLKQIESFELPPDTQLHLPARRQQMNPPSDSGKEFKPTKPYTSLKISQKPFQPTLQRDQTTPRIAFDLTQARESLSTTPSLTLPNSHFVPKRRRRKPQLNEDDTKSTASLAELLADPSRTDLSKVNQAIEFNCGPKSGEARQSLSKKDIDSLLSFMRTKYS